MLPGKHDSRWRQIIEGSLNPTFSFMAASMCVSRNQRNYKVNPSDETMEKGIEDLITFFNKYQAHTEPDLKRLFG